MNIEYSQLFHYFSLSHAKLGGSSTDSHQAKKVALEATVMHMHEQPSKAGRRAHVSLIDAPQAHHTVSLSTSECFPASADSAIGIEQQRRAGKSCANGAARDHCQPVSASVSKKRN